MTIVISAKVGEGLVLGADSVTALQGVDPKTNQQVILNTFDNARKLSQLKDYPIGIMSWGLGALDQRNIASLVDEFGNPLPKCNGNSDYDLTTIAKDFFRFIKEKFDSNDRGNFTLGMSIGGYSSNEFFPKEFKFTLPQDQDIIEVRPNNENQQVFGVSWYGLNDGIVRFHFGFDDVLKNEVLTLFENDNEMKEKITKIFKKHEYRCDWGSMPLQDAIDYVNYLINLMIGKHRFYFGPPLCGGQIDIAIVTYNGFKWVKSKEWKVN